MRLILLMTALFIASGCKKEQAVVQPVEINTLNTYNLTPPYVKWTSYGYHNYTIDQIRQCFCPNGTEKMRVVVRDDTVTSVVRLSDNKELSYFEARYYMPVDSLFKKVLNPGQDSIVVSFNQKFGYPEMLDINPQLHPQDGGVLFYTSNLRIP